MGKKPESIFVLLADDGWGSVLQSLREGEIPLKQDMARALRGPYEIPSQVRNYLADDFEGKIKRPRGRPNTHHEKHKKFARDFFVVALFEWHRDVIRNSGESKDPGTPTEVALERTSEELVRSGRNLSPAAVRAIVYDKKFGIQHAD